MVYALFTEINFSICLLLFIPKSRGGELSSQHNNFFTELPLSLQVSETDSTPTSMFTANLPLFLPKSVFNLCSSSVCLEFLSPFFLLLKFKVIITKLFILLVLSIENSQWSECTNMLFSVPTPQRVSATSGLYWMLMRKWPKSGNMNLSPIFNYLVSWDCEG